MRLLLAPLWVPLWFGWAVCRWFVLGTLTFVRARVAGQHPVPPGPAVY